MDGALLSTYCSTCRALRAIKDWHECRDVLLIDLEPCGHVARRTARLEWLPAVPAPTGAALRSFSLAAMEQSGAR